MTGSPAVYSWPPVIHRRCNYAHGALRLVMLLHSVMPLPQLLPKGMRLSRLKHLALRQLLPKAMHLVLPAG